MDSCRYAMPTSLPELARCLEEADATTYLLGGGSDLLLRFQGQPPQGTTFIDLGEVPGLDAITVSAGTLTIGANVTYARIAGDRFIREHLPCLASMAGQIGSPQIRNMARLPGNLANASPGGDAIGTLLALEAEAIVLDAQGQTRPLQMDDLVLGPGRTRLTRKEAIVAIRIPVPGSPRNGFGKLGMAARREVVIANLSLTMVFAFRERERTISGARIVLGSAAPKAYRVPGAERLCLERTPSTALEEALADELRRSVEASIQGNPLFLHKLNDVQGLARDVFRAIFADLMQEP